ncbi:hypothetical protein OPQ81_008441 [Rhizoctonia solani]|nr:hypothetical protein OPQ81_008441 [Rhizoctonia solani]
MTICDYRDSSRQVEVVLHDYSNPNWDARLDSLQVPRIRRPPPDPEAHNHSHPSRHHFDRQSSGISPSSEAGDAEEVEWESAKDEWRQAGMKVFKVRYKPVARKVRPVDRVLPDKARTMRQFPEDPVATLPKLPTEPPPIAYGE